MSDHAHPCCTALAGTGAEAHDEAGVKTGRAYPKDDAPGAPSKGGATLQLPPGLKTAFLI